MGECEDIVSRHPVSDGTIVYARCVCGLLRVWHRPPPSATSPARLLIAGDDQAAPAGTATRVQGRTQ
ncbi:hypothetical protein [Streptomyces sp. NPDC059009]|uniref:hypothetical protein n=1 Tax=Streptomyces sp. NPDC059009 TaxID=3346694 RepID=UPI0036AC6042